MARDHLIALVVITILIFLFVAVFMPGAFERMCYVIASALGSFVGSLTGLALSVLIILLPIWLLIMAVRGMFKR